MFHTKHFATVAMYAKRAIGFVLFQTTMSHQCHRISKSLVSPNVGFTICKLSHQNSTPLTQRFHHNLQI